MRVLKVINTIYPINSIFSIKVTARKTAVEIVIEGNAISDNVALYDYYKYEVENPNDVAKKLLELLPKVMVVREIVDLDELIRRVSKHESAIDR